MFAPVSIMQHPFRALSTVLLLVLIVTTNLFAQTTSQTGSIVGEVRNQVTREPVSGASVAVIGSDRGAVTKSDGAFSINALTVGTYRLRASRLGYKNMVLTDVVVAAGKPTSVYFMMEESPVALEDITVTPEYFPIRTIEPVGVLNLSKEEIRRFPGGFEDVVRAVSVAPGVAQVQAGRNDLVVRGGAPSENLYLIDNIAIPNINHFATQGAGGGPLSFVNLDFVDQTSFSTGGFGVRYGDKLSSVLSIDLKDGRTDRMGGKATIAATQFGLNLEGPISSAGSFLMSIRRSYLDFIFKAAGFAFVPEYWDFLGKASYNLSPADKVSILNIGAIDDVRLFNDTPDRRYSNSQVLVSTQREDVLGASWQHLFRSGYFNVVASQTIFTYDTQQQDSLLTTIFSNVSREYETSLRGEATLQVGGASTITMGLEAKPVRFAGDIMLAPFASAYGDTISVNVHPDLTGLKAASFFDATTTFGEKLRATAGIRADYFSLLAHNVTPSYRASLTYAFTGVSNLSLSGGRYTQAPSTVWLATNAINRQLDFINCDQAVLGIDHLLQPDIKVDLEVYLKQYSSYPASTVQRYLVQANTGAGYGGADEGFASFGLVPLVSEGTGKAWGIELSAQKKLAEIPLYGTANLSWSNSEFAGLDGVMRPGSYDQRWIANIGGGYIFNDTWEVSAKFRFASGRPYTPFNADGTRDTTQYNALRTASNHALDIRVERRWNFSAWNLIAYIDVQNVYNRKPVDVPRWDERTNAVAKNNSIGILPSIGVSAEF